jgi:hypothetical protein
MKFKVDYSDGKGRIKWQNIDADEASGLKERFTAPSVSPK